MRKTYTTVQVAAALMTAPDLRRYGREICAATGMPSGSVHPVLARMAAAGWLSHGWEDATLAHAEGRPPRRYYEVTAEGREALAAMLAEAGPRFGVAPDPVPSIAVPVPPDLSRQLAGRVTGNLGIKIVADGRMPPGAAALTGPDHDGKPQVQPVPPASKPARKPRARKAAAAAPAREASAKARCMRRLPKGAFCGSCGHVHG